ncbi:hypothetical protein HU200_059642 [Digitaria exilis]|uniref:GATA-type domain-containing protein n=1 Tax=Digitaria exilis TaxID=1010633 RepID=A0A835AC51_9POAL|nr:hypothetical protein HU200_059642 [Digitaria exilis]
MLLSVVVSFFDRDVRRGKRSTHLAAGGRRSKAAPTKWSDFRLSAVPPPPPPPSAPAPVEKCSDCGTTSTPQWRSGPMGPPHALHQLRQPGAGWPVSGGGSRVCTWRGAVMARSPRLGPGPLATNHRRRSRGASPKPGDISAASGSGDAVSDHPPPPQRSAGPGVVTTEPSRICAQGAGTDSGDGSLRPPSAAGDGGAGDPAAAGSVSASPTEAFRSICEQGLALAALAPDVLRGRTPSPNPVTPPSPAPATATAGRELLPLPPPPAPISSAPESSSAPGRRRKQQPKRRWVRGSTCQHCGSTSTPQWRGGPDGRRSLCNACGVRYRQGRLLPEYRPKASPTFDRNVHASWHSEVLRRRRRRNSAPMMMTPPPPATMTPPPIPLVNVVAREPARGANNADPMEGLVSA